jgi:hypothetical protein
MVVRHLSFSGNCGFGGGSDARWFAARIFWRHDVNLMGFQKTGWEAAGKRPEAFR